MSSDSRSPSYEIGYFNVDVSRVEYVHYIVQRIQAEMKFILHADKDATSHGRVGNSAGVSDKQTIVGGGYISAGNNDVWLRDASGSYGKESDDVRAALRVLVRDRLGLKGS